MSKTNAKDSPPSRADLPRRATRRRRVVLAALSGALVTVILLALFSWRRLELEYSLWQLRGDAEELVEPWLLAAALDPLKDEALRRFFREPQGQDVLFRLYLAQYDERQHDPSSVVLQLSRQAARPNPGDNGLLYLGQGNFGYTLRRGDRLTQSFQTINVPQRPAMRAAVLARMEACAGASFRTPELPGYEFHIERIVDGVAQPPPWGSANRWLGALKHSKASVVCHFRLID